jgi:hypothetical protein
MAALPDIGMDRKKFTELLGKAKQGEVHCAIGISKPGVVFNLDRSKSPSSLLTELKNLCKDLKNPNFGTFEIGGRDHRTVVLRLDKPARGLADKVKRALAGTGYSKVEIRDKDGSVVEAEDEAPAAAPAAPRPAAEAAPATADAAPAAPAGGVPDMAQVSNAKLVWEDTLTTVEGEVEKLRSAMAGHYKGHGFADHLDRVFAAKIEPMMGKLDRSLIAKLDAITKTGDHAEHIKLVGEARAIIKDFESYLAGEPIIAKLDANPFVTLGIGKKLTSALQTLNGTLA